MTSATRGSLADALMIISAGIEAIPGIRRARERGLHVVVSDANPHAPGVAYAHDFLHACTYDPAATVAAARDFHRNVRPLSGVMTIASDVPLTVAAVAAALNLPGIPLESARLASDKLAMKRRFARDDVPIPWFMPIADAEELRRVVCDQRRLLVIKPVDSRGARGVLRLSDDVDLDWAFDHAQRYSPTQRVMVEAYLDGPQISTETLMLDGVAHTLGFSDRNYELLNQFAPHIIEDGGDLPSHLPATECDAVKAVVAQAALSMGVRNGVVKGDMVVHNGRPYVIELAARLSGGYFCSHEIPLNTGIDFVGHAIALALGERVESQSLAPRFNRHVSQRYLFPRPGRVVRVEGADAVAAWPDISLCEVRVKPGDVVGPANCHPARAGVVIATGADREQAMSRAMQAVRSISIVTEPVA